MSASEPPPPPLPPDRPHPRSHPRPHPHPRPKRHASPPPGERVDSAAAGAGETTRFVAVLGLSQKIRVGGTVDERITAIAACQRGRLARWQLLAAGVGPDQIDRLLDRGRLVRRHA